MKFHAWIGFPAYIDAYFDEARNKDEGGEVKKMNGRLKYNSMSSIQLVV